jgi:hypothetical protein
LADYPWAMPHPVVLLGIAVAGLAGTPIAVWRGLAGLRRARRSRPAGVLRAFATLSGAAALGVYTWGLLHLLMDESQADENCKAAVGRALSGDVAGYDVSFLPLRFGCRVDGVGTFEAVVPGHVNPTVFGLVLLTALLAGLARVRSSGGIGAEGTSRR